MQELLSCLTRSLILSLEGDVANVGVREQLPSILIYLCEGETPEGNTLPILVKFLSVFPTPTLTHPSTFGDWEFEWPERFSLTIWLGRSTDSIPEVTGAELKIKYSRFSGTSQWLWRWIWKNLLRSRETGNKKLQRRHMAKKDLELPRRQLLWG